MGRKTIMNKLTTEEDIEKINPDNKRLLRYFLDYLRSTQRSLGTIKGYESDLLIFFCYVENNLENKAFTKITKRELVGFQNWLIYQNNNSPARVRRIKSSIASLSNFIESVLDDEEEYKGFHSIVRKIESPVNQPVREKTVLTEEQVNKLLDYLIESKQYEKACAVSLALNSGRRKAELPRFRVSDFEESHLVCNGGLYKSSPIKTKGRGVNGKQLECFCLAKKFKPYLDAWLEERKRKGIESEWLLCSKLDPLRPLSVGTLNMWATQFSKIMGVDFYWHSMRHLTVTNLKRAGVPDTVIQQYIGWSDISMVPVYVDMNADEQLGMYFDAEGVSLPEQKSITDI